MVFDSAGNLYGETWYGGIYGGGTVFRLTPKADGVGWTEKILHNFGNGKDGANPSGGLMLDSAGNLYGTTFAGGAYDSAGPYRSGTAFELVATTTGDFVEKRLHNFGSGQDGQGPFGPLVFDGEGNIYGTAANGGAYQSNGTVFELTPDAEGQWSEKTLHNFGSVANDGFQPLSGVIFDAAGNLYGTTGRGGAYGYPWGGTVFELIPNTNGDWTEKILHSFGNGDGVEAYAPVIIDAGGNLYGTIFAGGTVFELSPTSRGNWTETALYTSGNMDTGLLLDPGGNLYGSTGGGINGAGFAFKIVP